MPREIRKIESYNPTLALGLEANATKWISEDKKWGIRLGVRVEGKGMKTKAEVKNYLTEIKQDNSKVRGYYTGKVQTTVKIPISQYLFLRSIACLINGTFMVDFISPVLLTKTLMVMFPMATCVRIHLQVKLHSLKGVLQPMTSRMKYVNSNGDCNWEQNGL